MISNRTIDIHGSGTHGEGADATATAAAVEGPDGREQWKIAKNIVTFFFLVKHDKRNERSIPPSTPQQFDISSSLALRY